MATPRVITGSVLPMTAPVGGVTTGVPLWIEGLFVVPNVTAAATVRFAGEVEGVFALAKATGFALAEGEACYWDDTAKSVKAAAASYALIGHCATKGGVASGATSVRVRLQQSPVAAPVTYNPIGFAPALVEVTDPGDAGAIPVVNSGFCAMTTGGAGETRTFADPASADLTMRLYLDTDGGGDAVVTAASTVNQAGGSIMTFGDAGDFVELHSMSVGAAYKWRVIVADGVTIT